MQLHVPGFTFDDLFVPSSLARLTGIFAEDLTKRDPSLSLRYRRYIDSRDLTHEEVSSLLVDIAPFVAEFLSRLFGIEAEYEGMKRRAVRDAVIFSVKKEFVIRRALRHYSSRAAIDEDLSSLDARAGRLIGAMAGLPRGDDEMEIGASPIPKTEISAN